MNVVKKNKFYTKISDINNSSETDELYKHFRLNHKPNLVKEIKWLKFFSDGCIQILTKDLDIITYNDYVDNQIMVAKFQKDLRHIIDLS